MLRLLSQCVTDPEKFRGTSIALSNADQATICPTAARDRSDYEAAAQRECRCHHGAHPRRVGDVTRKGGSRRRRRGPHSRHGTRTRFASKARTPRYHVRGRRGKASRGVVLFMRIDDDGESKYSRLITRWPTANHFTHYKLFSYFHRAVTLFLNHERNVWFVFTVNITCWRFFLYS